MSFKYYIDGQLTDQPVSDPDVSTSISRDNQKSGITVAPSESMQIVYNGNNDLASGEVSGYQLIKDAFDSGSCNELDILCYDEISPSQTILIFAGVIKVPEVKVDEQRLNITAQIQDNSFYAYINNNKSIEYNIQSLKTKNREDITPPQIYEVDCFETITGIYASTIGLLYQGYRVYDVFRYLVSALSDNKIGFESYFLQQEPELFIFDGAALVNANSAPNVKTSFNKLFDEINKIKNIAFYIDTNDPENPILRIEDKASLFSGVQVYAFEDIKELTAAINTKNIYGTIRVGASDNPGGAAPLIYTFLAGTSYVGWVDEVYAPLGQCNPDNELNLLSDFGITHNDVYDQLAGALTSDLDKMFLIECENVDTSLFTADAKKYNSWINTAAYYYNEGTNNPNKLLNHGSNFQSVLTNTLEIGGNGFQVSLGQDAFIGSYDPGTTFWAGGTGNLVLPIVYTNETSGSNYDGGGNYDNITGIYVAPQDGLYSFNSRFILDVNVRFFPASNTAGIIVASAPLSSGLNIGTTPTDIIRGFTLTASILVYTDNTLSTLVSSQIQTISISQDQYSQIYTISRAVNLTAGQAVITAINVKTDSFAPLYFGNNPISYINTLPQYIISVNGALISSPFPYVLMSEDSTFKCTGSPDGGGITIDNDPALYKNKEYSFDYDINQTDWDAIKKNPTGLFTFEKDGVTRYGWVKSITRNEQTGNTQIKLISENASPTQ